MPQERRTRSGVIPAAASSTHRQMTDEQLSAAGIPAGLVRMSCGLENKQDLIDDIAQALEQVK